MPRLRSTYLGGTPTRPSVTAEVSLDAAAAGAWDIPRLPRRSPGLDYAAFPGYRNRTAMTLRRDCSVLGDERVALVGAISAALPLSATLLS